MFLVSQSFLDDTECRNCTVAASSDGVEGNDVGDMLKLLWNKSRNNTLERLSPEKCIAAYGTMIQSERRNLLVVTSSDADYPSIAGVNSSRISPAINNTNLHLISGFDAGIDSATDRSSLSWMCSALTDETDALCMDRLGELKSPSKPWIISSSFLSAYRVYSNRQWSDYDEEHQWPVDYCLSEPAPPRCRLHFSSAIAIVVTILNFSKAALMFYVAYSMEEHPLMTIGDAVASFLDEEDETTKAISLLSVFDIKKGYTTGAKKWEDRRWRWKDATSKKRRATTFVMYSPQHTIC
jgi:hypothetical protein